MQTTLKVQQGNRLYSYPVTLDIDEDRILFESSPFAFKDEIRAMAGARWHGFDEDNPRKIWSVANCPRNVFQLKAMMGEDVYAHWDTPYESNTDGREVLHPHQNDMIGRALQYHYWICAGEPGMGKSLMALEVMEQSGVDKWWYVGPGSALESFNRQLKKWKLWDRIYLSQMTYEGLVKIIRHDFDGLVPPNGIIFDECDLLKNPSSQRTVAAQAIADLIRETYGFDGYVIGMGGTTEAKSPGDLWSQCEVVWPGFLREGSLNAFERRYREITARTDMDGTTFNERGPWIEEEVSQLPERTKGLKTTYRKSDWLDLPEKTYETIRLEPSAKVLRVARMLNNVAPNTITSLTWNRALSSGFQYTIEPDGEVDCTVCGGTGSYSNPEPGECPGCKGTKTVPNFVRKTTMVDTPKDGAIRDLLDRCEPYGRIVIAAAFQGSVDRCIKLCAERGWAVTAVDGRGWRVYDSMGSIVIRDREALLDYWEDNPGKVAFVGNPESCGYGLTLTAANTLVFFDNGFKAAKRCQMEDRIHRISMDISLGAHIIDLIHLPVDKLVIDVLRENKRLEHLSLGVLNETLGIGDE